MLCFGAFGDLVPWSTVRVLDVPRILAVLISIVCNNSIRMVSLSSDLPKVFSSTHQLRSISICVTWLSLIPLHPIPFRRIELCSISLFSAYEPWRPLCSRLLWSFQFVCLRWLVSVPLAIFPPRRLGAVSGFQMPSSPMTELCEFIAFIGHLSCFSNFVSIQLQHRICFESSLQSNFFSTKI